MEQANTYLELILQDNENLLNSLTGYNNKLVYLNSKLIDPKVLKEINTTTDKVKAKELAVKVSSDFAKKMNEDQKNDLLVSTGYFRAYATRIMIKLNPVLESIDLSKQDQDIIKAQFEHIKISSIPSYDVCESFVQNINNILATQINAYKAINVDKSKQEYLKSGETPNIREEYDED